MTRDYSLLEMTSIDPLTMNGAVHHASCVVGMWRGVNFQSGNSQSEGVFWANVRRRYYWNKAKEMARKTTASHTRQEGRKCILGTILIL